VGAPISRSFEANPVFDIYAATIMTLHTVGDDFVGLDDLCAPAVGATPELDKRRADRGHFASAFSRFSSNLAALALFL
jgi:hypothetical protein